MAREAVRGSFVAIGEVAMWSGYDRCEYELEGRAVDAEQNAESALSVVQSCVAWSCMPNGTRSARRRDRG